MVTNGAFNSSSNVSGGAVYANSHSTIDVSQTNRANNTSGKDGGCIYSEGKKVMLSSIMCEGNSAVTGGCVHMSPSGGGMLTVSDSRIRDNKATVGGGLWLGGGEVTVANSEITGNNSGAYKDGGTGQGGGIFGITTDSKSPMEITMTGSMLAGNTASSVGAGIELENFSSLTAVNSTFADEGPADAPTHGLHFDDSYANFISSTLSLAPLSVDGVVEGDLRNSILADSGICLGNILDDGYNLQYPAPARVCNTSIPVVDPRLVPGGLKDNGGPTRTIAETRDSPAIDSVAHKFCTDQSGKPLKVDQRGKPRPDSADGANGPCDAGAYEYQE